MTRPRRRRRRGVIGALSLALAAPLPLVAQQPPQSPSSPGTLAGLVTEADTGQPLPGALVIVEGAGRAVRTGPRGTFAIPGIRAGLYTLRVRQLGYRDTSLRVRAVAGEQARYTVILAPDPLQLEGLTITGEARSRLVGVVVDEISGRPLANTLLRVEPRSAAVTDSIGVFSFRELPDDPGLLRVDQFGYEPLYVMIPEDRAQILEIALRPETMEVEGLTVEVMQENVAAMTRYIRNRHNAAGVATLSWDQRQLAQARSPDMQNFFEFETPVLFVPCPLLSVAIDCVRGRRGAPVEMIVCVDEVPANGGLLQIGGHRPDDFYRIEVYSGGALVLAYTRRFMERLARAKRALIPLDYLDCSV